MAVAKEQIRQIISENNISSIADVYALLKDSFKDILQELMEAELDATLGYVHFAPVSGHWCVCQWPLGATSGRKLIDYFVFDHNVIMFCYPLKQRVG